MKFVWFMLLSFYSIQLADLRIFSEAHIFFLVVY